MTYKKPMSEILLERLTSELQTFDQLAGGMTSSERDNASTTLSNLAKKGQIRREGLPRYYRYALAAPRESGAMPLNPAGGPCIDALSILLRSELEPLTRDEIIGRMPKGYAPHQIVSAMTDAINAGWLRAQRHEDRLCYVLIDDAPEPAPTKPDPLAAAFVPKTTHTRVAELQAELSALLLQQVGDHASPTVLHHIAAAGHHLHQLRSFID
jgi:hypothetical protein